MPIARLKQFLKRSETVVNLYRSLRFWVSASPADFFHSAKRDLILKVRPYTMLSWRELSGLYDGAMAAHQDGLKGAFVELGVCNGGSAGILSSIAQKDSCRPVWLFDSWQGLPEPGSDDVTCNGEMGEAGICLGSEQRVRELLFSTLGSPQICNFLIKGWFEDTVPLWKNKIGPISLLHLDGDWYSSIKLCLDEMFDQVVDGGFIFIDDYGYWAGARKAVDEFLAARGLTVEFHKVDSTVVWFRKPASARRSFHAVTPACVNAG